MPNFIPMVTVDGVAMGNHTGDVDDEYTDHNAPLMNNGDVDYTSLDNNDVIHDTTSLWVEKSKSQIPQISLNQCPLTQGV